MPGLESPDDHLRADLQADVVARVDAEQRIQHGLDVARVADLDEHRRRELAGPGQQVVVHAELVRDLRVVDDPLGADHLLDLEPHGPAVLEDE